MKLFFLAVLLISLQSYAAMWATITADKAVIYSDIEMQSAIGYIRGGKKIRIGEKLKSAGRLYSMVYKGKIVFISKNDVQTADDLKKLQSATERSKMVQAGLPIYNRISVALVNSSSSYTVDKTYKDVESFSINSQGFSLSGLHVRPARKYGFGIGLSYASGVSQEQELSKLDFDVSFHKFFTLTGRFDSNLYLGFRLSPLVSYSYADDFSQNGYGYGAFIGTNIQYEFSKKWGIFFDANISYDLIDVELPEEVTEDSFEASAQSVRLLFGLSYQYE